MKHTTTEELWRNFVAATAVLGAVMIGAAIYRLVLS
jgi:hypothetical protein